MNLESLPIQAILISSSILFCISIWGFLNGRKFQEYQLRQNQVNQTNLPVWRRKLRKLKRDPVAWFKDSVLMQLLLRPGERFPESQLKQEELYKKNIDIFENTNNVLFTEITNEGRIFFKEPPDKPIGLRTAFLYSEDKKEYAESILQGLSSFQDFKRLHRPHLQVGVYSANFTRSVSNILQSIDLANKKKVSSLDHIILLDPSPNLSEALRLCGTNQRIIVILTNEDSILPNQLHTDVLIKLSIHKISLNSNEWRRVITINDVESLPTAIRRAVQEGVPKSPDLLLPVLGFNDYCRDDLLKIDTRYHQGLIHLPENIVFTGKSMTNSCDLIAKKMISLAVTESCYLHYRDLCENIENLEARKNFLKFSLFDGVLFDVKA